MALDHTTDRNGSIDLRWLAYPDPQLEETFLEREYSARRHAIRINVLITLLVLLGFSLLDPLLVPDDLLSKYYAVRLGVLVPLAILAIVGTWYLSKPSTWFRFIVPMLLVFGLSWTWLLQWNGEDAIGYLSLGLIQTTVGTLILLGLPVRISIPTVGAFCGPFIVYAMLLPIDLGKTLTYTAGVLTVAVISAIGAVRSEHAARQQLIAQRTSEVQSAERLAIEAERNEWLEAFARFIRHEMKNAIGGVSTSIELAIAIGEVSSGTAVEYMGRGQKRLEFMRRLLDKVVDATNVETALTTLTLEPVDLSALVRDRAKDLGLQAAGWVVEARITPGLWVSGDEDSLNQLLDKLLDNALEYGDRQHPLTIDLIQNGPSLDLTITDRGDAIPDDPAELFKPFATTRKGSSKESSNAHLGLGLFVARTIALRHGGDIVAKPLDDPPGASFTVTMPALQVALNRDGIDPMGRDVVTSIGSPDCAR